jgi:hypothetical protein
VPEGFRVEVIGAGGVGEIDAERTEALEELGEAFGGFVVRETMNALDNLMRPNAWTHPSPHRVGWAVDGIMDVVGPLVVALTWTLL